MNTELKIKDVCDTLCTNLIEKNRLYGDSLQNPKIKLSNIQNSQKILSRLEDKINRFASVGFNGDTEDSLLDAFGYYVHYIIAKEKELKK